MSLIVQLLQIATVEALEARPVSFKVMDSQVDPLNLRAEPQVICVVSAVEGRFKPDAKALFSLDKHAVDLVFDFAVARKVTQTIGEGVEQTTVEFPDDGAGHDFALRTAAYEAFAALANGDGAWADLWREIWVQDDQEAPSNWERGIASDKGVRLGILRYTLKVEVLNDHTPGEAIEAGGLWDKALALMDANAGLADKAKLWRKLMVGDAAQSEWRNLQTALGLSFEGARGVAIAPVPGSTAAPGDAPTAATTIAGDEEERDVSVEVSADEAVLIEGENETTLIEEA